MEAYNYLTSDTAEATSQNVIGNTEVPLYLLRHYEQILATWFLTAGLDVQYNTWGWGQLDNVK
jgi:hypothetical protein